MDLTGFKLSEQKYSALWGRWLILLFSLGFLGGCGGGLAELDWELQGDGPGIQAVSDSGVQLLILSDGHYGFRNKAGERLSDEVITSRPRAGIAFSKDDAFYLYGVDGQSLFETVIGADLQLLSDELIYTGGTEIRSLKLDSKGSRRVFTWNEGAQRHYWIPEAGVFGSLSADFSVSRYSIDPDYQYWLIDTSGDAPQLVQIDLISGAEVERSPLPAELAATRTLAVNQGFVVATRRSANHGSYDLMTLNRATGTLDIRSSSGNFGGFDLGIFGQDATGTIYYYYFASFPHSGFSGGLRLGAVSSGQARAWEKKLGSAPLETGAPRVALLDDGLRMMYSTISHSLGELIKRTITSNYLHVGASGATRRSFYLQPVVREVTYIIGFPGVEIEDTVEAGYRVYSYGVDAAGEVYMDGFFEEVEGTDGYEFSGRT